MAIPLLISTGAWTVMNFIDRMFLLRYSEVSMAAVLPAGMLHFAIVCFPLGVAAYVNTFVAQYHGSGQPQKIGPAVWQGIFVGLLCIPLFIALTPYSRGIFWLAGHKADLAAQEALFFQTALYGAGAEVMAAALTAFFVGRGATSVVMLVDSLAWSLTVLLDYAWIFGHFGFPSLGIRGAALATVTALWCRAAIYMFLLLLPQHRRNFHTWRGARFDEDSVALHRRVCRYRQARPGAGYAEALQAVFAEQR